MKKVNEKFSVSNMLLNTSLADDYVEFMSILEPVIDSISTASEFVLLDDTYKAFFGKDPNSNEKISDSERALSMVGVALAVTQGKVLSKGKNIIEGMSVAARQLFNKSYVIKKDVLATYSAAQYSSWNMVFENGIRPKDLLKNKPLLEKFRKDKGIPEVWDVSHTKKGEGLRFSRPGTKMADEVRIKEGDLYSRFENSKVSNVRIKKNGKWRDILGKEVPLQ